MHTTNYTNTFIAVSADCPVEIAEIPPKKKGQETVASLQFTRIYNHPYKYDSDDIIFHVYAQKKDVTAGEMSSARVQFFSKGQACLRSSPLVKRYGWGVHNDEKGRVAIYAMESPEYKKLLQDKTVKQLKGMRSKKA
jgi:hypothetical protein